MERRQFLRNSSHALAFASLPGGIFTQPRGKEVLAFYYGWYGDDADKATWRDVDQARFKIGNTAQYPLGGPYSSANPAVVARQMDQMSRPASPA